MKRLLLTGFEPFEGREVNASEAIVRAIGETRIGSHEVVTVVLPCVFGQAIRALKRHMARHDPAVVICLGEAVGRSAITPERVAINVDDARIPDNAGRQPIDKPIRRGGPAAYFSGLPIKAIVYGIRKHGIPASVSQTAGTFVCNHVFYGLMHELAVNRPLVRGGFIHVPSLPGQPDGEPGLPLETSTEAIRTAIAVTLARRRDMVRAGGREN